MPGQKISTLAPVSDLQAADQLPLARSGTTYKITGDKFASKAQLDSLSATAAGSFALKTDITSLSSAADAKFIPKPASASNQQVLTYNSSTSTWVASATAPLLSVVDSPTIDLSYNSTTGILSANATISVVDSPTIDLSYNSTTGILSANATISVVDSPTIDLSYNSATGNLSASIFSIDSFFTGTNRSLVSPSGFQKLPGGLIINWGRVSLANNTGTTLNYAQSFTAEVLGVSVAAVAAGVDNWAVLTSFPSSLTQIGIGREWTNGPSSTDWCFYIAIGY